MMPPCMNPCCWVSDRVQGSSIATAPASTRVSEAPIVFIASCRSKLARTRAAKPGSFGSNRTSGMAAPGVDVYVNVNYAPSGGLPRFLGTRQQRAGFLLMHLHLVEVGLQVRHLLFELLAVLRQYGKEFLQLRPRVARAVVDVD